MNQINQAFPRLEKAYEILDKITITSESKSMYVDDFELKAWADCFEPFEHVRVVAERKAGMEPAHNVQFGDAQG